MILNDSYARGILCVAALCLAMGGCAQRKAIEKPDSTAESQDSMEIKEATIDSPENDEKEAGQRTIIYFDFDSSDIRPEFRDVLMRQASSVAASPNLTVRLEGHTDSRGSREYNIGLGERRAQSVRQFLTLNGASRAQLETVSYGEERPAAQGDGEFAWRTNRRVEIVAISR